MESPKWENVLRAIVATIALGVAALLSVAGLMPWIRPYSSSEGGGRSKNHDDIATLSKLIQTYRMDTGEFPNGAQGLRALQVEPHGVDGWQGPYIIGKLPKDTWARDYVYHHFGAGNGEGFEIKSLGADGLPGGAGMDEDIEVSMGP